MPTEGAVAFAERLKSDEALQSRLAAAASGEERLALAREAGFDLSVDDVGAVKRALGIEELSDADLERVAGGAGAGTVVSAVSVATVAVASAAF